MRIILFDIDTLRSDHLGCYGYNRNTSPNIDAIAQESLRFERYYCADAPCLPSRAGLCSGRFGFHTGIVGHGGTASDMRLTGAARGMRDRQLMETLFWQFRKAGLRTASVSTFAERHSAYWFNAGFNDMINNGGGGNENADMVADDALMWLEDRGREDNWFLHVHMWDPHTPYRVPDRLDDLFKDDPAPEWLTEEVFREHLKHVGPHSLHELNGFKEEAPPVWKEYKKYPGSATTYLECLELINKYDRGVYFADEQVGRIIDWMKKEDLYDDAMIIVTGDHGENMGELGIYAEHGTCDEPTTHIPMIIRKPGLNPGVDNELRYQIDLVPTIAEMFGLPVSEYWDGKSYYKLIENEECKGWDYLVLTQCAHVCQRSVRFDDYYYIRTYHDGLHEFPDEMLFDLKADPYEQYDLAEEKPEICAKAARFLEEWIAVQFKKGDTDVDPLWTVMKEGGPLHAKCDANAYVEHLKETGRADGAERLKARHPELF